MSTLLSDVISYANSLIQGNGNITDAQGIAFYNDADRDYHLEMIKRGVEASQIQEAYRNVTVPPTGQGSTFLYPSDMLLLKTLSVNMATPPTGSSANMQNYVIANQVDLGNTQQNQSFEWMRLNQPIQQPLWDDRGDWFEVFPTFTSNMNLVQALRIFYYLSPTPLTSVSDTIPYPENLDYYILANKMVSLYYESLVRPTDAEIFQNKYIKRIERLVVTLVKGADKPITTTGLGLTGGEF